MGTVEDAVTIVRAAFEPSADRATKQQAAALLRSLLAVLEATPGAPLSVPGGATTAAGAATAAPAAPDPLGAFIALMKQHIPADRLPQLDQPSPLKIPLIPLAPLLPKP